jgi:hypothetical protein
MKPFHKFLFHTMESRLSRILFTNFSFTRWNLGYHEACSRISLSHDGISAITKPFHEFVFHTMESRLSRSLFTNFSFTRLESVLWTSLGPLPQWVPGPTTRWVPETTRLALRSTWWRGAQGLWRRSTRLGSCTCPALYGRLLDVLD